MSAKHQFVDDYPYLAYSSEPDAAIANSGDVAALDARLDDIEANGWVTTSRISDEAVTGSKIADGAIDSGHLAADAVKETTIADSAVTTDKIADGAVTQAKLAGE